MLDVSQATNMLTSMGVSRALAASAAERTAQSFSNADPLTFLKELRATLETLSAQAPGAGGTASPGAPSSTAGSAASASTYQSTADRYTKGTDATSATGKTPPPEKAAAPKAPFDNLDEFKQWEKDLGDTFAADYEPPDYLRVTTLVMSGGDDTVVGRYMFFKNHPEFAADYESIRNGNRSQFPTDGSTLVKSDVSKMSTETADYYRKNPDELLAAEGFSMDPTLAKMRMDGALPQPYGVNASEWLTENKWTADGPVAQNNRVTLANADYIGLDGKGAGTYKLPRIDLATGNLINFDGRVYDPLTGALKA